MATKKSEEVKATEEVADIDLEALINNEIDIPAKTEEDKSIEGQPEEVKAPSEEAPTKKKIQAPSEEAKTQYAKVAKAKDVIAMKAEVEESKRSADILGEIAKSTQFRSKAEKIKAERDYMIQHTRAFKQKLKESEKIVYRPSPVLAPYFGKVYTFMLNCVAITIRFDGKEQLIPACLKKFLDRKLESVAASNVPKERDIKLR